MPNVIAPGKTQYKMTARSATHRSRTRAASAQTPSADAAPPATATISPAAT